MKEVINNATESKNKNIGRLLISCVDRPGIVSCVSNFLFEKGANIVTSDQHTTDPQEGQFFMRVVFHLSDLKNNLDNLKQDFLHIARDYDMQFEMYLAEVKKKVAIFVSKEDHCLRELLWQSNTLDMDVKLVISNHNDSKELVESYNIPFYHLPVAKDKKNEIEAKQLEILKENDIDLIILARYMQILTPNFISHHPDRIINIHHSFLPAFIGANPYQSAYERGVKIIGATAHYVTNDLDEGPIIEQDVERVYHSDHAKELKRIGSHIERIVLARAVSWHLDDKILTFNNKTIVFR
ncbi:formyltetrahydrofolate deformylase [Anaerobacillus alkalilacustris]|uniref:Formyltetrahydrofolate deformylase n=1 Tax=Anaerobacillus alkalilacustris TaxID=393763 RepID=A0A1S2LG58_9BACI|nr:formyltetrahydrofolate deformylase [Anaerobacillus alkalilacustris]OIJ11230.1 formyltetrahydrofolate deformylase [Anaerobacillus alkalilacustris]